MKNRPCWSSIWPEKLPRDKKAVLAETGFEYDYGDDAFVHLAMRKVASFDAVSDMQLDDLSDFAAAPSVSPKGNFRFRGSLEEGRLAHLLERYGWA